MSADLLGPTYHRTAAAPLRYRLTVPDTGEILTGATEGGVTRRYLAAHAPALLALVEKVQRTSPQLGNRTHRAALLVAAQAVQPGRGPLQLRRPWRQTEWVNELARVRGRGPAVTSDGRHVGRDWYSIVEHPSGDLACNCADWADGHAPQISTGDRVCKHILAYHLAETLAEAEAGR
jgi:hypothetical protein